MSTVFNQNGQCKLRLLGRSNGNEPGVILKVNRHPPFHLLILFPLPERSPGLYPSNPPHGYLIQPRLSSRPSTLIDHTDKSVSDEFDIFIRIFHFSDLSRDKLGAFFFVLIPSSQWKEERFGVPWQAGETVSLAIGQSYALVTPLQMASLMSAIFNGGKIYKPKVVNWIGKDEKKSSEFVPTQIGKMKYSDENIELIRNGLIGVVNESRGTGRKARLDEITVAGKTGTAQVIALEAEKELKDGEGMPVHFKDHAWFIAIAPAEQPQLALAILIENGGHGGSAAAPIAGEMFKLFFGKDS